MRSWLLVEADQPAPGMDPGRPQPVEHRAMENALQLAAMNGELGHIVSGVGATQFLPHRLAEAIAIEQLASPDADAVELRQQTELRQNADGVRQHVEADAEFAQLGLLRSSSGSRPSCARTLMACGSTLKPTPSSRSSGACSNISASMPAWCRQRAVVSPPTPPPTITTFLAGLFIVPTPCRLLRRAARSRSPNRVVFAASTTATGRRRTKGHFLAGGPRKCTKRT